eukprot:CAMPEP_0197286332 /NCGR_PEP_ID=MMETSP0890-20130614/1768_1 /TAXON_ID=44058 ORGANISM="Aureoumbra lagunensis, Strain CCMP1510" /NCGR_SAMPLE_ID=MMETSP0890 /ASSEMBLY_ACC=CAM_ASM_000533 /LENGTH=331 /DNA_ID=CAMNT_0042754589 /DNA_START=82 /DNA_END=1077 /DNA_ORIENTATION=+
MTEALGSIKRAASPIEIQKQNPRMTGIPIDICQSRALEGCPLVRVSSLRCTWPQVSNKSENENACSVAVFLGVGLVAVAYHPPTIMPSCDAALAHFLGTVKPELARGKRVLQVTNHSALSAIAAAAVGALSAIVQPRSISAQNLVCRGLDAARSASRLDQNWSALEIRRDSFNTINADIIIICDIDCRNREHLLSELSTMISQTNFAIVAWPIGKQQASIERQLLDALSSKFDLTLLDLPDLPSDVFKPLHNAARPSSKKRSFSDISTGPFHLDATLRSAKSRVFLRIDQRGFASSNLSSSTGDDERCLRPTGNNHDDYAFLRPRAVSHDV